MISVDIWAYYLLDALAAATAWNDKFLVSLQVLEVDSSLLKLFN